MSLYDTGVVSSVCHTQVCASLTASHFVALVDVYGFYLESHVSYVTVLDGKLVSVNSSTPPPLQQAPQMALLVGWRRRAARV
jgi:hypothetical protein